MSVASREWVLDQLENKVSIVDMKAALACKASNSELQPIRDEVQSLAENIDYRLSPHNIIQEWSSNPREDAIPSEKLFKTEISNVVVPNVKNVKYSNGEITWELPSDKYRSALVTINDKSAVTTNTTIKVSENSIVVIKVISPTGELSSGIILVTNR